MEYNNDCISLMLVATSLCSRYDEWTQNMLDILDMNTNETCKKMRQQYPEAIDSSPGAETPRRHADFRQDPDWQDHHPRSGAH
jgi:hypothetical protein